MALSSQYYFIISLSTWGVVFLYFGFTTMIRNSYNPFADGIFLFFVVAIGGMLIPIKLILGAVSDFLKHNISYS